MHHNAEIKANMFMRFTNGFAPFTRWGGSLLSKSFNRFFSTQAPKVLDHIPRTHNPEHLQLQQKLFKIFNIPAELTFLPKGTKLVGLNSTLQEAHSLGTVPVYHPEILKSLSPNEMQEWLEMSKNYRAQVGEFETISNLKCLKSSSKNGIPIYHIDFNLLEEKSYTPVEKIIDLGVSQTTLKK